MEQNKHGTMKESVSEVVPAVTYRKSLCQLGVFGLAYEIGLRKKGINIKKWKGELSALSMENEEAG